MKPSIETIWQQGFINEDALIAPKINDLYNQKSQNIIDKFERLFQLNTKAILIGMVIVLIALSVFGFVWLGLYINVLLLALVYFGKQARKKLVIDKSLNSYEYLTTFNNWLHQQIASYTQLYRYFYPLLLAGVLLQVRVSESMNAIIHSMVIKDPELILIAGTPLILLFGAFMLIFTLWLSSTTLYRWDLDIVYGNEIRKLDALINEMKTLRENT